MRLNIEGAYFRLWLRKKELAREGDKWSFHGTDYILMETRKQLVISKSLFQELFRSDHYSHISPSKINGRCYVMSVRDYFKVQPEVSRPMTMSLLFPCAL